MRAPSVPDGLTDIGYSWYFREVVRHPAVYSDYSLVGIPRDRLNSHDIQHEPEFVLPWLPVIGVHWP